MVERTSRAVLGKFASIVRWASFATATVGLLLAFITAFQSLSLRTATITVPSSSKVKAIEGRSPAWTALLDKPTSNPETPQTDSDALNYPVQLEKRLNVLEERVQQFQDLILDDPSLLVTLPLIEKDLRILKEEGLRVQHSMDRLARSVGDVNGVMRWLVGALITLFVGVFGAMLTILNKK